MVIYTLLKNNKKIPVTGKKMNGFAYDITKFKFSVADTEQVKKDFIRDSELIFINGKSLKEIYNDMNIIVEKEGDLQEKNLSMIWNEFCFTEANEEQLSHWQKFANALFHQGGLLYAFESVLREKMSVPENNSKVYIPEKPEKEVHISFDKQRLTIQEKCIFTQIRDPEEKDNLVAKKGSYLIKAQLSHYITLIKENDEPRFRHVIAQPEYKCKHSELQKCLNQRELSIMEALKNIIRKLFGLKPEPNSHSFFQKPCYQAQINQSQINMQDESNNMLKNRYTRISNHG